ncbi:hypothetical protein AB0I60_36540 [Actinosynnema sp. NPDC050436]|uniref:hypothetical protein n=1 Tax=Actinosynnema sp. NPDC050436 TaxID=3155659 RepID=UPI0033C927B0
MTALLVVLTVLALVVYGLERNHHRHARFGPRLAGSHDVDDRDLVRVSTELHAPADHPAPARPRVAARLSVRSV